MEVIWCNTVVQSFYFPFLTPESLNYRQIHNKQSKHDGLFPEWSKQQKLLKLQRQCEFPLHFHSCCSRDLLASQHLETSVEAGPRRAPSPHAIGKINPGLQMHGNTSVIVHSIGAFGNSGIEKRTEEKKKNTYFNLYETKQNKNKKNSTCAAW